MRSCAVRKIPNGGIGQKGTTSKKPPSVQQLRGLADKHYDIRLEVPFIVSRVALSP